MLLIAATPNDVVKKSGVIADSKMRCQFGDLTLGLLDHLTFDGGDKLNCKCYIPPMVCSPFGHVFFCAVAFLEYNHWFLLLLVYNRSIAWNSKIDSGIYRLQLNVDFIQFKQFHEIKQHCTNCEIGFHCFFSEIVHLVHENEKLTLEHIEYE